MCRNNLSIHRTHQRSLSWFVRILPWLLVAWAKGQIEFSTPHEVSDYLCGPRFAQTADLDGDGDLDAIAAANSSSRISWWKNSGNGEFGDRSDWTWDFDSQVIGIADSDNNGTLDLWIRKTGTLLPDTEDLWIAKNDNIGNFAAPIKVSTSVGDSLYDSFVLDANLDGRSDLLTNDGVFFQKPDGSFAPPTISGSNVITNFGLLDRAEQWAIGAFGGQHPKIISAANDNTVFSTAIHLNGSFGNSTSVFTLMTHDRVEWMTRLPPDGNGNQDRLVFAVTTNPPDGQSSRRLMVLGFESDGTATELSAIATPKNFYPISGFWDQQRQRLLIFSWAAETVPNSKLLSATFNGGNISLTELFDFDGQTWTPTLADMDGNGVVDLFMPLSSYPGVGGAFFDHLTWHAGNSSGNFEIGPRPISQPALASVLDYAGDLDNDGDGDIVTSGVYPLGNGLHELVVWRNMGNRFERQLISDGHRWIAVVSVGDRNGDNLKDILLEVADPLRHEDGTVSSEFVRYQFLIMTQALDGSFSISSLIHQEDSYGMKALGLIDWNRDGIEDLVATRNYVSLLQLVYLPGKANGSFGAEVLIATNTGVATLNPYPKIMDIDWDGDPDIYSDGELFGLGQSYWFENDGGGGIASIRKLPSSISPLGVDYDSDGHEDFTNFTRIHLSRPGATFSVLGVGSAIEGRRRFVDLDGDGDLDCLESDPGFGSSNFQSLSWRENRRSGQSDPRQFLVDPGVTGALSEITPIRNLGDQPGSRIQCALADIDGDGVPDLVNVWASTFSGTGGVEWIKISKSPTPSVFSAWMQSRGLTGHSAGPLADWDADGESNWTEFAFGSDPGTSGSSLPYQPRMVQCNGQPCFLFQRRKDHQSASLVYLPQRSTDLRTWTDWNPEGTPTSTSAEYETMSVEVQADLPARFFRIAIPPPSAVPE